MARSDYKLCGLCDQKAYYDADTDYGGAYVFALCSECKKLNIITTEPAKGFLGRNMEGDE